MQNNRQVAYFSMEIALEPGMPTYCGGLGFLAGDLLRAAAEQNVPIAGVSLLLRRPQQTRWCGADLSIGYRSAGECGMGPPNHGSYLRRRPLVPALPRDRARHRRGAYPARARPHGHRAFSHERGPRQPACHGTARRTSDGCRAGKIQPR